MARGRRGKPKAEANAGEGRPSVGSVDHHSEAEGEEPAVEVEAPGGVGDDPLDTTVAMAAGGAEASQIDEPADSAAIGVSADAGDAARAGSDEEAAGRGEDAVSVAVEPAELPAETEQAISAAEVGETAAESEPTAEEAPAAARADEERQPAPAEGAAERAAATAAMAAAAAAAAEAAELEETAAIRAAAVEQIAAARAAADEEAAAAEQAAAARAAEEAAKAAAAAEQISAVRAAVEAADHAAAEREAADHAAAERAPAEAADHAAAERAAAEAADSADRAASEREAADHAAAERAAAEAADHAAAERAAEDHAAAERAAGEATDEAAAQRAAAAAHVTPAPAPAIDPLSMTMSDPLARAERDALTQLRRHEASVRDVEEAVARLRLEGGRTTEAEVRRVVGIANCAEELLGVPRKVLGRDALAQEWPGDALAFLRGVVGAIDAFEAASAAASAQLLDDGEPDEEDQLLDRVCDSLERLLSAWVALLHVEAHTRTDVVRSLQLNNKSRARSLRPLCDALLDKAVEVHDTLTRGGRAPPAPVVQRICASLRAEDVRKALAALSVEVPRHALFDGRAAQPPPSPGGAGPAAARGSPSGARASPKLDRLDSGGLDETMTAPASPAERAIEARDPHSVEEAADAAAAPLPSAPRASPPEAEKAAPEDPLESTLHVPRSQPATQAQGRLADVDDLTRTVPAVRGALKRDGGPPLDAGIGSPKLWHAVHVGDLDAVRELTELGRCTAGMRDASDHSVLWHALAFGHAAIADFMLDEFPPGGADGADLEEVHPRKGDTLLHLMCSQSKSFGTDSARLFKRISMAAPRSLFLRANYQGLTFLHLAAASLNFWVLTFVLRNFPEDAQALVVSRDAPPLPMSVLAGAMAQPAPPRRSPAEAFPEHFRIAEMLQQDDSGAVPYADVAFDVGVDASGLAACRFLAHRVIVMSQSPVLFEELKRLPLVELAREQTHAAVVRIDPSISQAVWRSVLQFMYTGSVNCAFADDTEKVFELLRACVMYRLPRPLGEFAQTCLYTLLPRSPPKMAVQVFAVASRAGGLNEPEGAEYRSAREASAYILLRSAHVLFDSLEAAEACRLLERAVQTAEHAVFNPVADPWPPAGYHPGATAPRPRPDEYQAWQQQQQQRRVEVPMASPGVPHDFQPPQHYSAPPQAYGRMAMGGERHAMPMGSVPLSWR